MRNFVAMLLELNTSYDCYTPKQLLTERRLAEAGVAEAYYCATTGGAVDALLIAADSTAAIADYFKAIEDTNPDLHIKSWEVDGLALCGVTLPPAAISLDSYLRKHGPIRWDIALPLAYEYLHQIREVIRAGIIPAVSPADLYLYPDPSDSSILHGFLPLLLPHPVLPENGPWDSVKFCAPDQLKNNPTLQSLLFSFSLTLNLILTGDLPWQFTPSDDVQSSTDYIIALSGALRKQPKVGVPGLLKKLILKNLSINPMLRDGTVDEYSTKLFNILKEKEMRIPFMPETEPVSDEEIDKIFAECANDDDDDDTDKTESGKPYTLKPEQTSQRSENREPRANIIITRARGNGFDDVAGLDDVKAKMTRNFIDIVQNPELAKQFRIEPPNGLLLWGPPGNGKTFISRKLAEQSGLLYTLVNPSDLGSIFIHGSQGMIADLFKRCEDKARREKTGVLMVLEEFDSLVPNRAADTSGNNRSDEVAEFLTRLNNCASKGVYVVATTNRIDAIDPAVMRKGRMDEVIYIGLPDAKVRHKLFELELRDRPHDDLDLDRLTELTDGFSSGDISFLVKESARKAFQASLMTPDKSVVRISQSVIEATISEANPSVTSAERHNYEKLRKSYDRNRQLAPKVGF